MAAISKDRIYAYLSGLISACGPSPSIVDAASYSRQNQSLISPGDAIYGLGAKDWSEAVDIYNRYLTAANPKDVKPIVREEPTADSTEAQPTVKPKRPSYTREELLVILRELYEEFGGGFTVKQIRERAKSKPTPAYETFCRHFGSSINDLLEAIGAPPNKQESKKPAPQADKSIFPKPKAKKEKPLPKSQPPVILDPATNPQKFTMELKIWPPGVSDPIVMEITIK
ncbi:hypothetical protein IKF85_00130 [Candidatus Saccharibacteria bacterium]|nr:hypothetical protein [Candidatus Saccharibacteria bacterium]